jgi:hypothetical protein
VCANCTCSVTSAIGGELANANVVVDITGGSIHTLLRDYMN